jgi:hypothetical protein
MTEMTSISDTDRDSSASSFEDGEWGEVEEEQELAQMSGSVSK